VVVVLFGVAASGATGAGCTKTASSGQGGGAAQYCAQCPNDTSLESGVACTPALDTCTCQLSALCGSGQMVNDYRCSKGTWTLTKTATGYTDCGVSSSNVTTGQTGSTGATSSTGAGTGSSSSSGG